MKGIQNTKWYSAATFCLLIVFALNSILPYLLLSLERSLIRHRIRASISNRQFDPPVVFVVNEKNQSEFIWEEEDEFNYQGRMYDVVKIILTEKGKEIYCLNDEQESELIDDCLRNSDERAKTSSAFICFLSFSFFEVNSNAFSFNLTSENKIFGDVFFFLTQIFLSSISPPPDLIK